MATPILRDLRVRSTSSPSEFMHYDFAMRALEAEPVNSNVILPILLKCRDLEAQNRMSDDHLWIVVYNVHEGVRNVVFIASCTNGYLGKYPIFLFTPIPYASLFGDNLIPALQMLVTTLQNHVPPHRVYSVFGPEIITRKFSSMWTYRTHIQELPEPYYHAKVSYLTRETLIDANTPPRPNEQIEIRPANPGDIPAIAEHCGMFAAESPPFTLSARKANKEAKILVQNEQVWVYSVWTYGQPAPQIASIVAFTRNTAMMATITKVYTHPQFRGQRRAEQLVREVCKHLIGTLNKQCVALFVGIENKAANVYHRVGFVGLGQNAPPVNGIDPWIEIGFDTTHVELGHW